MLYDILPPAIFFVSFAGIIIVLSRVVMRVRRQEFSQEVQTRGKASNNFTPDQLVNPAKGGVNILKTRAAVVASSAKKGVSDIGKVWQRIGEAKAKRAETKKQQKMEQAVVEEKAEEVPQAPAAISMPTESWREKVGGFFQSKLAQTKSVAGRFKRNKALSRPQMRQIANDLEDQEEYVEEKEKMDIRIIRVDTPAAEPQSTVQAKLSDDTEIKATRIAIPQAPFMEEQEVVEEKPQSPQGRFIARLTKREKPKTSELQAASDAIDSKKYQQAEDILIPYIIDHAKDARAYMLLGKIAIARSAWSEAIEIFQQVIRISPNEKDAHAGLGFAAMQYGKFTIALQSLQRAHEADPENVKILEHLLDIARRLDNKVLQKSVLEQLTILMPQNQKVRDALQDLREKEKVRA